MAVGHPCFGHNNAGFFTHFFFSRSTFCLLIFSSPAFQGKTPSCASTKTYKALNKSSRALCSLFSCAYTLAYVVVPRNVASSRSGNTFPSSSVNLRAKPKSIKYNRFIPSLPFPTHTFPGLISLCTYPAPCMLSSASSIAIAIAHVVLGPNRPPRARLRKSAKFSPTSSIARNGFPSCDDSSSNSAKCSFPAIARITRASRALVLCSLSTLTATRAPSRVASFAAYTSANCPRPSFGADATVNRPSAPNRAPGFSRLCGCANCVVDLLIATRIARPSAIPSRRAPSRRARVPRRVASRASRVRVRSRVARRSRARRSRGRRILSSLRAASVRPS